MKLTEILDLTLPVYAHKNSEVETQKETLQEHTDRCEKYFMRLLDKEKMRAAFEAMEPVLTGDTEKKYADWFWQSMQDVILFHDTGKINPIFQQKAMENKAFDKIIIPKLYEKNHAALSAYIYLDYHVAQLEQMQEKISINREILIKLYEILCVNAYLIMKHHSNLSNFAEFVTAIQPGGKLSNMDTQMIERCYHQIYKGKYSKRSVESYVGILRRAKKETEDRKFAKFCYTKLLFSLLMACDYYATNEYMTGTEIKDFGSIRELTNLRESFEKTKRMQAIRAFQPQNVTDDGKDINYLRTMLFYEAEQNLIKNSHEDIFYLEAPTGCGKSNTGFNCSFHLAERGMGKIIYVYPFNNLVEQNKASLEEMFEGEDILKRVAIVNSITPIKRDEKLAENHQEFEENWSECNWSKSLLDRQFLNYPILLTTHASLFQTMFGTEREAIFGFHQLVGSVIVLDEIQSYKNAIWTEIMMFLQYFCKYLHCKVLVMSATLPNLTVLTGKKDGVIHLIENREFYFCDKRFQNRVEISYELLKEQNFDENALYLHIKEQAKTKKKILVEFIQKEMAYRFFDKLASDIEIKAVVDRMTGDDNSVDREKILQRIKTENFAQSGYILIATQVVEAGIDIDMDIGYKDISTLDSEEQFIGRINRNAHRNGIVFYFDLYPAKRIYGENDYRVSEQFTLKNVQMQQLLIEKNFSEYYGQVMKVIQNNRNNASDSIGIETFMEDVGSLNFRKVMERMQLIEEDQWRMSVFLARTIVLADGKTIDGKELWNQYKQILSKPPKDYAQFRVKLSEISSKLNLFIYQIKKNSDITYTDRVGEIYCIENGEDFFVDDRLDKKKLEEKGGLFIDI